MTLKAIGFAMVLFLSSRIAYADDPVTFNNQVVRIFQQHCQTCHRPGNIAPFSLMTYADARPWAASIRRDVMLKTMPPWKAVGSHGTFEGERSLTDQEIQTISQWVTDGAPEGSREDLPEPLQFSDTWTAGTPDMVLQPPASYNVSQGSDDIYRCFPMTVNSVSDLYVRGYEVLPGNRAIVHHVLLFADQLGQSASFEGKDASPGYSCFGGIGFLIGLFGGWAPGAAPEMFPVGTGVHIAKGTRIVMQVHYSLRSLSASSGAPDPDLTRVGLYLSPVPLDPISFLPIVNPFFTIPPGQSRYKVTALLPILRTVELVAIAPHMHLLGREATVVAHFPNGSQRELIHIDNWDFHWQGNYIYKDPLVLPAGTLVELTAYYDNSLGNPQNPTNPPVPVSWGERTVDEMCLTFLSVKKPGIPSMNTLSFAMTDRSTNSVATQGASTGTHVGYARVTDSSGNAAPSGMAIFGYRQNGVLVSEAAVSASKLIAKGRLYAENSTDVKSGVAIANPNSDPAVVSFTFVDETGQTVASGSTTIAGNGQIAGFLSDIPFSAPPAFSGTFTFSASKPIAVVGLRGLVNERSELIWTTLPVTDLASPLGTPSAAVFPDFADGGGWRTQIQLVNPADTPITGSLRFVDPSGRAVSYLAYSIPARSAQRFFAPASDGSVRTGAVTIVPSGNTPMPGGSLIFSYTKSNVRVSQAAVPVSLTGNAFRLYVEASDTMQSGIAIMNNSASSASVRLELMDLSGGALAGTTITLGGNAQLAAFLTEIPGLQSLSLPIQGALRISSASPIAVLGLRSRTNERGDFLVTTTPPVNEADPPSQELFFPHFADSGGYTTQFILFNGVVGRSVNGTLRFFSQSGQPLGMQLR
jgi:hypothetical protein